MIKTLNEETEVCTWEMFEYALLELEQNINRSEHKLDGVYGIPRGGLPIAVCLSHRLGLPLILDKDKITKETLIVDDISDKGDTLIPFKDYVTATLYVTSFTKLIPNFSVYTRRKNWVEFPWEAK